VNTLDLGALHRLTKFWLTSNETFMEVGSLVRTGSNTVKAPHIELSLEALVLGLVEVLRHDVFVKLFCLVDLESIFGRNPGDNIVKALDIRIIEDAVEFPWKRDGGSWLLLTGLAALACLGLAVVAVVAVVASSIESYLRRVLAEAIRR